MLGSMSEKEANNKKFNGVVLLGAMWAVVERVLEFSLCSITSNKDTTTADA